MTSNSKEYVLSKRTYHRLLREKLAVCCRCGEPFKLGDKITHRTSNARCSQSHSRYYHAACFESLYLDIPDDGEENEVAKLCSALEKNP